MKLFIFFAEKTKQSKFKAQKELKLALEKHKIVMEDIRKENAILEEKRRKEEEEVNKIRSIAADKEKTIDDLKSRLQHYEFLIKDANGTLR